MCHQMYYLLRKQSLEKYFISLYTSFHTQGQKTIKSKFTVVEQNSKCVVAFYYFHFHALILQNTNKITSWNS